MTFVSVLRVMEKAEHPDFLVMLMRPRLWKSPIAELRSAGRARAPVPTWALLAGGEAACFYVGIADPTPDI